MAETNRWKSTPLETKPEDVGYDSSRILRLQEIFERLVREGKIQGAAFSLSRHGRLFADCAYGQRHHEGDDPMETTTWRCMASITKVLTTIGLLKLVEDGRIVMEFPLAHFLPEFDNPTHGKIRLQHLLTHTSGIRPDAGSDGEPNPDHEGHWAMLQASDWISRLLALPLSNAPGEVWRYSSAGFALLGEVIARTVGEPYARWMEREILAPAGLADTFFDTKDRPLERFAFVSSDDRSMIETRPTCIDQARLALGHAYSNTRDLVRLGHLLASGGSIDGVRILGRRSVEAMTQLQVNVPAPHWGDHFPDWRYGLGLEPARHPLLRTGSVWGHEGSGRCAMWFDPETGLVASFILPTTVDWDPDFGWTPRAVIWSGLM